MVWFKNHTLLILTDGETKAPSSYTASEQHSQDFYPDLSQFTLMPTEAPGCTLTGSCAGDWA